MKFDGRDHNARALVWFLAGMLLFLAAGVTLSALRQRALLRREVDAHVQRELGLLSSLLRNDLLRRDHAAVGGTLAAFVDQHQEIHEVRIIAPDGSVPVQYLRSGSRRVAEAHTRAIEYAPGRSVTLEVLEDPEPIHSSFAALIREGIGAAILFTTLMGGALWFVLRRTALIPLEQRVVERTEALVHANRELEDEIAERTRTETALRKSEKLLQTIIDSEPECVKLVAADGSVVMMNRAGLAMIQADSLDQVKNKPIYPLVLPQYCDAFRALTEEVFQGKTGTLTFEMTGLKGGRLWLETHAVPLRDDAEKIVAQLAITRDVTEQKNTEAALRTESAFISAVLDTVASIVCVLDREGKIVRFNRACEKVSGYTFEEAQGRHVWDFLLPPEQIEPVKDVFANLAAGRLPSRYENYWVSRDGGRRLIAWSNTALLNSDGSAEYIIATGIDITESRAAEEARRESEERYRLLVHRSPIGIFNYDPSLIITDCNEAFVGILRAPREKLIGFDINGLQDRRVLPAHQASTAGKEGFYEGPYHATTSGADIWVSLRTAPLFDSQGAIIGGVGIVEDITARKQAEQSLQDALRRAEEEKNKSEAVIAAIGDGISIQDRDFKVLYQNEFHKKLIGAHGGGYCYKAYEGKDEVCEGCPVALSFQDGKIHIKERTGRTAHGLMFAEITASPLRDAAGNIIAGIEVVRDITERKRMEEDQEKLIGDLRILVDTVMRSRKEWRDTFDNIQDPIYITDAEYRIIKANRAFVEYTGSSFPDVLGRKCYDLLHGTADPYAYCPYQALKETGKPVALEIVHPVSRRNLVVSHFPCMTPEGEFAGSISIVRDVTEEREKEMRFIMNERLASLGQMAASIAHEINNPLTAILGCADGLRNRVNLDRYDPALFRKYLQIIEEEIGRCRHITTGMLSFVRKSAPEKKTVNMHETLDRALEIIGFQGRLKAVEVVKRFELESHSVLGNEGELKQVLLTLITNALDAMTDRGTLTIETRTENGRALVAFSDTGGGVAADHITRIFDPFFTTKADRGGTGLGLSIAKKILANHGGDILVASEPGKGATFTITLPKP